MVYRDELLCTFRDVQLLRFKGDGVQSSAANSNVHYLPAAATNDNRLCHQYLGSSAPPKQYGMPHFGVQHQAVDSNVLQLLRTIRKVLPQGLFGQR